MHFAFETTPPVVLVRASRSTGEWVLRRRVLGGGERRFEIILNGRLLMDTADGSSEEALAEAGLRRCRKAVGLRVLVGGLGFGFTLRAVLRDSRVAAVEVVEIEPALAEVLATPEIEKELGPVGLRDPRVRLEIGNVRERIARAATSYDCVLLDVDNGPGSVSAIGNEALYTEPLLRACRNALEPGGSLAIWSSEPAADALARLKAVFDDADEQLAPVARDGRLLEYRILCSRRADRPAAGTSGAGWTRHRARSGRSKSSGAMP